MPRPRTLAALLLPAALLGGASTAAAQQRLAYAEMGIFGGTCVDGRSFDSSLGWGVSAGVACAETAMRWSAGASNHGGALRSTSVAASTGGPGRPAAGGTVSGTTWWMDQLTVTAAGTALPGSVRLGFRVDGRLAAAASDATDLTGFGSASVAAFAGIGASSTSGQRGDTWGSDFTVFGGAYGGGTDGRPIEQVADVHQLLTVLVPLSFDPTTRTATVDFWYYLGTRATLNAPGSTWADASPDLDASADFGHTGQLAGVTFVADDPSTLEGLSYSFAHGTQLATTAPEPGSVVLLATGLVAVGGLAGRRRRWAGRARSD